jgi:hypothetical protein
MYFIDHTFTCIHVQLCSFSNTVSTPSPAKVKVQSTTTQGKSGGWKKKIAFGGSKVRGASSLDETSGTGATATVGGGGGGGVGGEKQAQEQMEVTMEKQLSEPIFTKVSTQGCFFTAVLW